WFYGPVCGVSQSAGGRRRTARADVVDQLAVVASRRDGYRSGEPGTAATSHRPGADADGDGPALVLSHPGVALRPDTGRRRRITQDNSIPAKGAHVRGAISAGSGAERVFWREIRSRSPARHRSQ